VGKGNNGVHRSKMDGINKVRLQQRSDINVGMISVNISRQGRGIIKAKEDAPTNYTNGVVEAETDDGWEGSIGEGKKAF